MEPSTPSTVARIPRGSGDEVRRDDDQHHDDDREGDDQPETMASPTRRSIRPRTARHASSTLAFLPSTASATTRTIMPVSTIPASELSRVPVSRAIVAGSMPSDVSVPSSEAMVMSPVSARRTVTIAGSSSTDVITSTARPTMGFGFRRIACSAPSYRSPRPSGRSGTMPGLWAGRNCWG